MAERIAVNTKEQAWDKVFELVGPGRAFEEDKGSSERAGYPIHRAADDYYTYVCDLNARLELNTKDGSTNIWIEPTAEQIKIDELTEHVKRLEKMLAEATEWQPYEHMLNVSQKDYDKLLECPGTVIWETSEAITWIADDFGFDPKKIKIVSKVSKWETNGKCRLRKVGERIRRPLFNASDWNYVRFDCGCMSWELYNGDLRPFCN